MAEAPFTMNFRSFHSTLISEVGLGTWQLGNADWGNVSEEQAFSILNSFVLAGGNFFDTADVYGNGVSEKILGKFLKTQHQPVYIATKLGRRHDDGFGWPQNFGYDSMKRQVEQSLENLGIPQLFLEQLHCIPTEELRSGKVFNHLRKLKEEKLLKHWGVSVETSEEALLCLEQDGIASLQIIFNLFRQHVADEVFKKAKEKNVALIIRVPLASGLLSGKFNESTQFASSDHRNFNEGGKVFNAGETFSGIPFKQGVQFARRIQKMLPDSRTASWAIRWILDHPEVTTVIPGASKSEQVLSNILASELPPLSKEIHHSLKEMYDAEIKPLIEGHY